jgi:hypothetical protein
MAGFGKNSPSVILLGQSNLAPDAKDCEAIFPQSTKSASHPKLRWWLFQNRPLPKLQRARLPITPVQL